MNYYYSTAYDIFTKLRQNYKTKKGGGNSRIKSKGFEVKLKKFKSVYNNMHFYNQ